MGQVASESRKTGSGCSRSTLVGHGSNGRLGGWVIAIDGTRGIARRATEAERDPGRLTTRVVNSLVGGP
jgi:hypothetical protein